MFLASHEKAQAILFLGRESIVKEFLYAEFQAILDGYIPLPEWAGRTLKSVYVEIDSRYNVVSAVFFLVRFDRRGAVDAAWNMPLEDLARTTAKGPDMGSGPIHLTCASQCPIAYYREQLWDPDLQPHSVHLDYIKKTVKLNKMGIHFGPGKTPATYGSSASGDESVTGSGVRLAQDMRDRVAQMLKSQRLRTAAMKTEKALALRELRLQYAEKMELLRQQLEEKNRLLEDLDKRNGELRETVEGQAQKIEGLREYFEHKLQRALDGEHNSIRALHSVDPAEEEARIARATLELSERLRMKEVELLYRIEHEQQLREEIEQLRSENRALLSNSGDHLLDKLSRQGVNFVTYQTGAGHISIPLSEVDRFMDSPLAFTADYCGVSEVHYRAWLQHYQAPVCCASTGVGERCCADVPRVAHPAQFIVGESDCCAAHAGAHQARSASS